MINPQNGHILDDAKPRPDGLRDDHIFETEALTPAARLRNRTHARSRVSFINASPMTYDGRSGPTILYNIAHKARVPGLRCQVLGCNRLEEADSFSWT